MFLIFDTETTGLPQDYKASYKDTENWPRMVQISWQIHDVRGHLIEVKNYIIKPEDYEIPYSVVKLHGITTERAEKQGMDLKFVLAEFNKALDQCIYIVGHNIDFDVNVLGAEYVRKEIDTTLHRRKTIDTKDDSTSYCALPGGRGGGFKWPKLEELHEKLFGEKFSEAHNAAADVEATSRCFLELVRLEVIAKEKIGFEQEELDTFKTHNPKPIKAIGLNTQPYDPEDLIEADSIAEDKSLPDASQEDLSDFAKEKKTEKPYTFAHLHVHTQYSILDGATNINLLAKKAKADGMEAVAITDHGNMFGVKEFHKTLTKIGLKPIIGCEAYVAKRGREKKEGKIDASGWHLVLLAKNPVGYKNLMKLVSLAWLEGQYYRPRIDKELLEKYHEGIIASSACLGGEISQKLMNESFEAAEEATLWYKNLFGDDFYLEIMRHKSNNEEMNEKVYNDQVFVNQKLIEIGRKHQIKIIATNDVHFLNEEDAEAQDRLLCISTGKYLSDTKRLRYTGKEWFKTQDEMKSLFQDFPEALANTQEIVDKVENFKLNKKPIMPDFKLPNGFDDENKYLRHIVYEGAHKRWGDELKPELIERLDFELETIEKMGFPGYFLIVWDFLKAARDMGVIVGPGRGSAAGSAVAYSLRITEIDPLKYNLLFERFLNPDRISMPDIDIDFDDEGRSKILKWVVEKYGEKRVAHIVTIGTMAAKSSIRDVARVQEYPLAETDKIAKLVPERPGVSLKDAFKEVKELRDIKESQTDAAKVLQYAETLEGTVRNTGTHACGIIIGKDDLENYIPISTAKDSELTYVTQYDGKHVEDIGLLKMDFLGLKTLSIIKHAIENIKLSKGITIDIDNVDLEDKKTYELYSNGETTALFQFESDGMKKHLKELKPNKFEDLIAMNALYRPGPMEYIPQFTKRKNGKEKIEYDLPMMKEYLEETYGITVYQEQVMLLSRKLAGFTRGQSDSLRKAMGKKIKSMMDELKVLFINGCKENPQFIKECQENNKDVDTIINKIWSDWEAFAKYAFNKSHATCYSYVSFQTAFLKANYPAEFMAAVLSNNMNNIDKVTFFINECNRIGIKVLGPSINESRTNFTVNKEGNIRFGLAAIKGVGEAAVLSLIEEREKNGNINNIFDFVKRINLRTVNKKSIESMILAGAFDDIKNINRATFYSRLPDSNLNFLEQLISFGHKYQDEQNSAQVSLFGDLGPVELPDPEIPVVEEWAELEKLAKEKEVVGFYLTGHPLDNFKEEINYFTNQNIGNFADNLDKFKNQSLTFAGIITSPADKNKTTKNGKPFGSFQVTDYSGSISITLFGEDFEKYKDLLDRAGQFLMVKALVTKPKWKKESDDFELKITQIELLTDVFNKYVSKLTLGIPLTSISEKMAASLSRLAKNHPGSANVYFHIIDNEDRLAFRAAKIKVSPKEFLMGIRKFSDIQVKIN
ncbi:MAG: DNA polymerase III subunit alpha [Bacteroidales bacterium]|nr:DNA polymerase III subunit alpha [Bacteroidales bacterium]